MCKTLLLAIAVVAPLTASPIAGGLCVPSGTNAYYGTLAEFVALGHDGCFLSERVQIYDIAVALPPLASPDLSVYRFGAFNGHPTLSGEPFSWPEIVVFGAPFTALPPRTVFTLSWAAAMPTTARGGEYDWRAGLPAASSPDSTTGTITATMTSDLPVLVVFDLTDAPEPSAFLPLLAVGALVAVGILRQQQKRHPKTVALNANAHLPEHEELLCQRLDAD